MGVNVREARDELASYKITSSRAYLYILFLSSMLNAPPIAE